jgi:hypothetical protein
MMWLPLTGASLAQREQAHSAGASGKNAERWRTNFAAQDQNGNANDEQAGDEGLDE